jgi:hypothetical protein
MERFLAFSQDLVRRLGCGAVVVSQRIEDVTIGIMPRIRSAKKFSFRGRKWKNNA